MGILHDPVEAGRAECIKALRGTRSGAAVRLGAIEREVSESALAAFPSANETRSGLAVVVHALLAAAGRTTGSKPSLITAGGGPVACLSTIVTAVTTETESLFQIPKQKSARGLCKRGQDFGSSAFRSNRRFRKVQSEHGLTVLVCSVSAITRWGLGGAAPRRTVHSFATRTGSPVHRNAACTSYPVLKYRRSNMSSIDPLVSGPAPGTASPPRSMAVGHAFRDMPFGYIDFKIGAVLFLLSQSKPGRCSCSLMSLGMWRLACRSVRPK